ncbi:MAG TPA: TRAM domain-containing protein [Candidatus Nitrosopolaris rasttigaisensis]|nr:TRAM domain-containing protein [Candidatus Nitrosopolaris rasttigaisensis]
MEDRDSHTSEQRGSYGGSGGGYRGERGYGGGYGGRSGGGFGGTRPFRPAPVKVGEEFEVKIESMSKRGDAGVAKVEGLVIFVAGTNVGDSAKIRITKVGRGYATAEIAATSDTTSQIASEPSAEDTSSGATTEDHEENKELAAHEEDAEEKL